VRSLVVFGAVLIGVWAILVLVAITNGMVENYISSAIESRLSHIQIHHPRFSENKELSYSLNDTAQLKEVLNNSPNIERYTLRAVANAMISTGHGVRGIELFGIDKKQEATITNISSSVKEGNYFESDYKKPILLGKGLAEKLQLELGSKAVITLQDSSGSITAAAYKICGLFETGNKLLDENLAYVRKKDFYENVNRQKLLHEAALLLKNREELDQTADELSDQLPGLQIETYREISPEVELMESQTMVSSLIFISIFMLALIFGIINTMLMAVLDRFKEIGMLMAIGMNKQRIFSLVLLETVFMSLLAAPVGLLLGFISIRILHNTGINLSAFAAGLEAYGISTTLYPDLSGAIYWQLTGAIIITAVLAAIYPGYKAVKLNPLEAIHKI